MEGNPVEPEDFEQNDPVNSFNRSEKCTSVAHQRSWKVVPIGPTEYPPIVAIESYIACYEHQESTIGSEPDCNEPHQKSVGDFLFQKFVLIQVMLPGFRVLSTQNEL